MGMGGVWPDPCIPAGYFSMTHTVTVQEGRGNQRKNLPLLSEHIQGSPGSAERPGELWGHSRLKTDLGFPFQQVPLPELARSCSEEESCTFFALLY